MATRKYIRIGRHVVAFGVGHTSRPRPLYFRMGRHHILALGGRTLFVGVMA